MAGEKWTPGPWLPKDMHDDRYFPSVRLSKNGRITINEGGKPGDPDMIGTTMETVRANAHLIASAPALYEALFEMLNYEGGASSALDDEYVTERAESALALARGEKAGAE